MIGNFMWKRQMSIVHFKKTEWSLLDKLTFKDCLKIVSKIHILK